MVAFGGPLRRAGMINRRLMVRALWSGLIFHYLGADEERMREFRESALRITRGWDQALIRSLVADTLADVVEPIVYDEALTLIRRHQAAGHRVVLISASPEEIVAPLGDYLGVDETHRQPSPDRRRRPVHGRGRVLRLRAVQGRGRGGDRGTRRARPRGLLGLLRLRHRSPAPQGRRAPRGREPRPGPGPRGPRRRMAGPPVPHRGAPGRTDPPARTRAGWPWARRSWPARLIGASAAWALGRRRNAVDTRTAQVWIAAVQEWVGGAVAGTTGWVRRPAAS